MIARIQRTSTFALLGATLLWLLACDWLQAPVWAYGGAIVIAFSAPLILAIEFVILFIVHGNDPTPRASAWAMARCWLAESRLNVQIFNWRQPFRSRTFPDTVSAGPGDSRAASRTPVVFVHGFICNRGFWLPLLRQLDRRGVPYIAVNLEPAFAESIDDYAAIVDAALRRAAAATGRRPVVVAHSMGGLVVRACLSADASSVAPVHDVKRIITIGSPHHGTLLARLSRAPTSRQMRRGSLWLANLAKAETASAAALGRTPYERYTCFYSDCDNIVMPASTATLSGADNRMLPSAAHVQLAFRDEVLTEILNQCLDPCGERTEAQVAGQAGRIPPKPVT